MTSEEKTYAHWSHNCASFNVILWIIGFSEAIVEIETTPDIALPQDAQEAEYLDNTYDPPGAEVEADNTQEFKQEDSIPTDDEAPLTIDESSRWVRNSTVRDLCLN